MIRASPEPQAQMLCWKHRGIRLWLVPPKLKHFGRGVNGTGAEPGEGSAGGRATAGPGRSRLGLKARPIGQAAVHVDVENVTPSEGGHVVCDHVHQPLACLQALPANVWRQNHVVELVENVVQWAVVR